MEKATSTLNDIIIYDYGNKYLHSFCICFYIRAGILYESDTQTGISHMWEHMIFKNINARMEGGMAKRLDRMGAYFNACTYKDLVEVRIAAASMYFDECAGIIASVFDDFIVDEDEFETEKKRIKAEIREDDEKNTIDYHANRKVWKGTGLSRMVAGTIHDVNGITLENIRDFHDEMRVGSNIFVYVTGRYTQENIDLLSTLIGSKKILQGRKKTGMAPVPQKMFKRGGAVYTRKFDGNEVRFSFDIDNSKCSHVEIDLLYDIMFNGESCRVFEELSDKSGLVYSYDSAIELYENVGNMYFSYMVKKKNLLESIRIVTQIIRSLKGSVEQELELAKQPYMDNADLEMDDAQGLNWLMAYEGHILGCGYRSLNERKKAYAQVTPERMREVINHVFSLDNMCIMIGSKKNKFTTSQIKEIIGCSN